MAADRRMWVERFVDRRGWHAGRKNTWLRDDNGWLRFDWCLAFNLLPCYVLIALMVVSAAVAG